MKILLNRLRGVVEPQGKPVDIGNEAFVRARSHRLFMSVLTAVVSAYWVGPYWALGWAAIVAVHETILVPQVMQRLVTPRLKLANQTAKRFGAALTCFGSCLYVMGWAPAYFTAEPGSGYFAGVWLACSIIHALIYSRSDRLLFAAHVAAPLSIAFAGAFIVNGLGLLALVLAVVTARLAFTTFLAANDRMTLLSVAKLNRTQRAAAEQANAAKSRFLSTMSHELRTPLNAIIGYAEMLEEDFCGNAGASEDARRIQRSARHLLGLINETLDLSKIESGRVAFAQEPVNIGEIVNAAVENVMPAAQRNNTKIIVNINPTATLMIGDPIRLNQCVLNLVANACKFTADGQVRIETAPIEREGKRCIALTVHDTGIGIAQDQLDRIFEPFVQADDSIARNYEGTGLGLAITRKLARMMGGDVTVRSDLGEGSAFTLILPTGAAAEAPAIAPRAAVA